MKTTDVFTVYVKYLWNAVICVVHC